MAERFLFVDTPRDTEGEFTQLTKLVEKQNENRENWADHDSPSVVAGFVVEEAKELVEAVELEKDPIEIASEIGDVLYLTLRLCSQLGIDPRDAVEMKIVRNSIKYPDTLNSTGEYSDGTKMSKKLYSSMGGDAQFYEAYSQLVADAENAPEGYSMPPEIPIRSNGNGHHPLENIAQTEVLFQAV